MSEENISVRQWQELFRTEFFSSKKEAVQRIAGWYDWIGDAGRLAGRLKKIARVVMGITEPYILDNYHIALRNKFSDQYRVQYDEVSFLFQDDGALGKYFHVTLDAPHENKKWTLITDRFDHGPEYECDDVRDMARYINAMAHDLEHDNMPPLVAEKWIVSRYAAQQGDSSYVRVRREGEGRYSYLSFKDRKIRHVLLATSLEDIPEGFVAEHAQKVRGMYVYCPEEAAAAMVKEKTPKRREPER